MAWTAPTAIFFAAIALALTVMTIGELRSPTVPRRGFLPIVTTRGDRLFIALLASAFVHAGWLAATDAPVVVASGLSAVLAAAVLARG
jgi:predicted small integral membrane protein